MNARAYFCILRPVRALVIGILYGWLLGLNVFKYIIRLDWPEALFLTLTVVAPFLLGTLLLGPIHEVMHRNFSALLPGVRTALLRWHMGLVAVVTVVLFVCTRVLPISIPATASLGYLLGFVAIPLLNERRRTPWYMVSKAVGVLALYVFLVMPCRELLLSLGNRFPWTIFVSGVGFAVFCFRRGFSERSVRERSRRGQTIFCYQSLAPVPGAGFFEMSRYVQSENARAITIKKAERKGRDWTMKVVGSSLFDWVRVIHHSRFGAFGYARTVIGFFSIGFAPIFSVASISFLLARFGFTRGLGFVDFYGQFVDACRLGSDQGNPADFFFGMVPLFGVMLMILAGAIGIGATFRFPISRQRRAKAVYVEMIRLGGLAYFGYTAAMFSSVVVACLIAGRPLELGYFGKPLLSAMVVPPLALINLAILHSIARFRWFISGVGFVFVILFGMIVGIAAGVALEKLGSSWFLQRLPVPGGLIALFVLLGWMLIVPLSLWLLKWALACHYRKCDLTNPVPWTKAFYPGT